jgi:hypothetical protein
VPEKRKRDEKRREQKRRKIGENTRISKVLPSLPPRAMVEQDWTPSTITLGHLQILVKHGFMAVVELEACRVPEDPTFPAPVEGYVVSFVSFYERGFDTPRHWFLRSLLWYYGLKLHHL